MITLTPRTRRTRAIRILALVVAALSALTGAAPAPAATPATAYPYTKINNPNYTGGNTWGYRLSATSLPGPRGGAPITTGDMNGDGVADFFVGHQSAQRVDLMSGATLALIRSFVPPASEAAQNRAFGIVVSVIGDTTGDGRPEVLIGSNGQDVLAVDGLGGCSGIEPNGCNEYQGRAWLFDGATGIARLTLDHPIPQSRAYFGSRIGRAGDVNNDTVADVFVGAPRSDVCATQSCKDAVNASDQKAAGDNSCAALPFIPSGCRVDQGQAFVFSGTDGALLRSFDMPAADHSTATCGPNDPCGTFGLSVQGPGDVTGDQVADQLVSAPSYNSHRGRMYLFSGANGNLVARIDGPVQKVEASFGFQDAAPLSPGDLNNDGHNEIYGNGFLNDGPTGQIGAGRAWVFDGKLTAAGTPRVLYEVISPQEKYGGQFGWTMATTDYNRDGRPDLYVGSAPHHMPDTADTSGGTYVFDGIRGTHLKTLVLGPADAQLGTPGKDWGSQLGWSLAAPGDLNGDGEADYLAGAPYQDMPVGSPGCTTPPSPEPNGCNENQGQVIAFLSRATAAVADFGADNRSDYSVFRPSDGTWYAKDPAGATTAKRYGGSSDVPTPADYDGDRKADTAVFRPSEGVWYVRNSSNGADVVVAWGTSTDIAVPGDYDGDHKADIAVFRPSDGIWYVRNSSNGAITAVSWGTSGDIPVVGDYDADRKADIAVFRPSEGIWYVRQSSNGTPTATSYGTSGDIPTPGDYDADGRDDAAVYRPSQGVWYVRQSSTGTTNVTAWGVSGDVPVPGHYDSDSRSDVAVFRPSNGTWYVRRSIDGGMAIAAWGSSTDVPLPLPHAIRRFFF